MSDELPVLISVYDQGLEQIGKLIGDIEANKWDAGVTVFVNNGTVDIRGIGVVESTTAAAAVLFMAFKSLPPAKQSDMAAELARLMERSKAVAKEAPLWRPVGNG